MENISKEGVLQGSRGFHVQKSLREIACYDAECTETHYGLKDLSYSVNDVVEIFDFAGMLDSDDIYEQAKVETIKDNSVKYPYVNRLDKVPQETLERIDKRAESLNLKKELCRELAVSSPVGWGVMVYPAVEKQVYHEKALYEFLKANLPAYEVHDLPNTNTNAFYIYNGEVLTGLQTKPDPSIKSIDFLVKSPQGKAVYVVHKYTMGSGGSQNNQRKDAFEILKNLPEGSQIYTLFVLDGTHYTNPRAKNGKTELSAFIDEIHRKGLQEFVFAGNYREALAWIKTKE